MKSGGNAKNFTAFARNMQYDSSRNAGETAKSKEESRIVKTREQTVRPGGTDTQRPGISGFVALILFIMVFSGALKDVPVLKALDFNNMMGAFGVVKGAEGNFQGVGGVGAKDGFMVAFAQLPLLMLAMGIVELATKYRALLAAKVLFTPILKPLLGIPGAAGLTLVSSLNSSDGGAVMTADLYDRGYLPGRTDYFRGLPVCRLRHDRGDGDAAGHGAHAGGLSHVHHGDSAAHEICQRQSGPPGGEAQALVGRGEPGPARCVNRCGGKQGGMDNGSREYGKKIVCGNLYGRGL